MQRLTREDEAILALESPTIAGHTCKVLVLEPSGHSGRLVQILRRQLEARLSDAPRLRQRLVPTPLGIAAPAWIDDPQFDIADHVRPLAGSAGARLEDLPGLAARAISGRLDRRKALWSLDVIDPLDDGSAAMIWRIHHCMADGTAALRLGQQVLWDSSHASAPPPAPREWTPAAVPGWLRLLRAGLSDRLQELARRPAARNGHPTPEAIRRTAATVKRELGPGSARSPFDARGLTADRRVAFASVPLADIKQLGRELDGGATVNDILLALVAGGLRTWIACHGAAPLPLRAKVPVSLHHGNDLANRDSFFFVELPLDEPDPLARLRLIRDATRTRKEDHDAQVLDLVLHERSRLPRPFRGFLATRAEDPRVAALSVSNVPGPSAPIFIAGARVSHLYSLAEIGERHALRISAVSLDGTLTLGFCAEASAVRDVAPLAHAVQDELAVLQASVTVYTR